MQRETAPTSWIGFWDSDHSIYVSARHRDLHYRRIADHVRAHVPSPDAVVLDYGCGEALYADKVANACGRLLLVEAASKVRAGLASRFAGHPKIAVRSPEDLADDPDASVDLVVMISVTQYLSGQEFDHALMLFRRLLKPGGRLLLGDVKPPDVSALDDAIALLRVAARQGFFGAALVGLARTAFSHYRSLRSTLGLSVYDEAQMREKLKAADFRAERLGENIGPNPARMTFLAKRD